MFTRAGHPETVSQQGVGCPAAVPRFVTPGHEYDAHPIYRRFRESGPACKVELPGGLQAWIVTRYHEVVQVLSAPEFTRDPHQVSGLANDFGRRRYPEDLFSMVGRHLLNTEGDDHRRLQRLVMPHFTWRRANELRPTISAVVDQTLDQLSTRDTADLVAGFSVPIPLKIISLVLGIPPHLQHDFDRRIVLTLDSIDPDDPRMRQATRELVAMTADLIRVRWDSQADDVVSSLIRAHRAHGSVSRSEIASSIIMLLGAGYETTASLLSSCALAILQDSALAQQARNDGGAYALAAELLRFDAPVPFGMARFTRSPVTLGGVRIDQGEIVYPLLASANRDPLAFDDPDTLDITRGQRPVQLAFGRGARRCLGAELAMIQAPLALRALATRFPDMRLTADPRTLARRGVLHIRGLRRLPVRLGHTTTSINDPTEADWR